MDTRNSPERRKTQKAINTETSSFRWDIKTRQSLLNTLIENPKLWGKNTMSKKAKFTRIVSALDSTVFENKTEMKWNTVSNGWDWLEVKYREQTKRFKMTGEGPTEKEELAGAKNLFGINCYAIIIDF
jgi:hypothetical protein